jgi:hypothetical protein
LLLANWFPPPLVTYFSMRFDKMAPCARSLLRDPDEPLTSAKIYPTGQIHSVWIPWRSSPVWECQCGAEIRPVVTIRSKIADAQAARCGNISSSLAIVRVSTTI